MFPYKGDFCLSIGRSVWIKARRNKDDPALTAAVDNWPNMYVNAWVKVENVLPAVELAGVIPFAVLSADRESIEFHLVLLKTDGTLLVLAGDSLRQNPPTILYTTPFLMDLPLLHPNGTRLRTGTIRSWRLMENRKRGISNQTLQTRPTRLQILNRLNL